MYDTPGSNDTYKDEHEILRIVALELEKQYVVLLCLVVAPIMTTSNKIPPRDYKKTIGTRRDIHSPYLRKQGRKSRHIKFQDFSKNLR